MTNEELAREAANVPLELTHLREPLFRLILGAINRAQEPLQNEIVALNRALDVRKQALREAQNKLEAQNEDIAAITASGIKIGRAHASGDKARLDWLEAQDEAALMRCDDKTWEMEACCPAHSSNATTAREAIDAAMKENK